jgi:hypothetical protein
MHNQIIAINITNINSQILVTFSINSVLLQLLHSVLKTQFWVHAFETNSLLIRSKKYWDSVLRVCVCANVHLHIQVRVHEWQSVQKVEGAITYQRRSSQPKWVYSTNIICFYIKMLHASISTHHHHQARMTMILSGWNMYQFYIKTNKCFITPGKNSCVDCFTLGT